MDEDTRKGLAYAAASEEAIREVLRLAFQVLRANFLAMLQEINTVRAALPDPLPPLLPGEVFQGLQDFSEERRRALLELILGQAPNELKPWEAV